MIMATIQENINTLSNIKADIKAAIIEKGVDAGDNITEYGDKILQISGGGEDTNDYLCFEAVEDSAISLSNYGGNAPNIEYSFDKQAWTVWDYSNIDILAGLKLYMRGDNPNGFCQGDSTDYSTFIMSGHINASGDAAYIVSKTKSITHLPDYGFRKAFQEQTALYTAPKFGFKSAGVLAFGATFYKCTKLYYSPDIEIERFEYRTCNYMFHTAGLTSTPQFKQNIVLAEGCFRSMYLSTKLKEAPYLPSKTLVTGCYEAMFSGCTSLQYIKAEFTTTPTTSYCSNWVNGVPSTGCFIKAKDASWTTKGNYACPTGWTLITSVS